MQSSIRSALGNKYSPQNQQTYDSGRFCIQSAICHLQTTFIIAMSALHWDAHFTHTLLHVRCHKALKELSMAFVSVRTESNSSIVSAVDHNNREISMRYTCHLAVYHFMYLSQIVLWLIISSSFLSLSCLTKDKTLTGYTRFGCSKHIFLSYSQ